MCANTYIECFGCRFHFFVGRGKRKEEWKGDTITEPPSRAWGFHSINLIISYKRNSLQKNPLEGLPYLVMDCHAASCILLKDFCYPHWKAFHTSVWAPLHFLLPAQRAEKMTAITDSFEIVRLKTHFLWGTQRGLPPWLSITTTTAQG